MYHLNIIMLPFKIMEYEQKLYQSYHKIHISWKFMVVKFNLNDVGCDINIFAQEMINMELKAREVSNANVRNTLEVAN